jgi:hypothetical protein
VPKTDRELTTITFGLPRVMDTAVADEGQEGRVPIQTLQTSASMPLGHVPHS